VSAPIVTVESMTTVNGSRNVTPSHESPDDAPLDHVLDIGELGARVHTDGFGGIVDLTAPTR
jgi:hypothetical protein